LTHPRFRWSIDIPVGFGAFPIRAESINGETGVLVSNFEVEEPWSLAEFRDFPPDGVALRIWSLEGVGHVPVPDDDSRLPLDHLRSFLRLGDDEPAAGRILQIVATDGAHPRREIRW